MRISKMVCECREESIMVRNEKMFVDKVMNHEFDGVILINPTDKVPKVWTCIEDGKIITLQIPSGSTEKGTTSRVSLKYKEIINF